MKVITKEQMEKILATFLRNGYSVDSINDDTYQWYLGWMNYGEDRVTLPLELISTAVVRILSLCGGRTIRITVVTRL